MTEMEKRMQNLKAIQAAVSGKDANEVRNISRGIEKRANESMSTGQDGYGQDFIPSDLASTVLQKIREQGTLMSELPSPIVMPTSTYTIPVEGGDPTWFATSESTNVVATEYSNSKAGTDDLVLTAKKYTGMVYASGELEEDSIVNIRTYLTDKLSRSYSELLDKVVLNGDTTTAGTGNVNSDDGAPTAGSYFLHQNGIFKKVIGTTEVDAGTLDLADIRAARKAMGKKGMNPSDLVLTVNQGVYFKLLGLTQAETMEKFGVNATVVNGVLSAIDGIKVLPLSTDIIGDAKADGKISTTA